MLARMPKLYGEEGRAAEADHRKVVRKASNLDVTVKSAQGEEAPVVIADISSHGCSAGHNADWLRQGTFVWLQSGTQAAEIGIVRWIRQGMAGIEFVRPLTPGDYGLASLIDDED